jgi:hypothetical protein
MKEQDQFGHLGVNGRGGWDLILKWILNDRAMRE